MDPCAGESCGKEISKKFALIERNLPGRDFNLFMEDRGLRKAEKKRREEEKSGDVSLFFPGSSCLPVWRDNFRLSKRKIVLLSQYRSLSFDKTLSSFFAIFCKLHSSSKTKFSSSF